MNKHYINKLILTEEINNNNCISCLFCKRLSTHSVSMFQAKIYTFMQMYPNIKIEL